ncbi:MAG TPA: Ig-like domain-containing protein [Taishania sp.]|nr:Ig-like domain-containing protein [Taishania sp.]
MAFRLFIISLLLVGCAQVKTLSGGPQDTSAPKPYAIVPKNETVNFSGQAIAITFNEYIKLNNPTQTISIIPNDVTVKSELKDKTLMLYWEEPLSENTTYSIYLNKTVRDITESNDSIMQIVFSTGSYIDSLTYSTFIVDAKSGNPVNNVVVGLFDHPDSLKPIYITQTDASGKATFNYLKDQPFYVRAFEDLGKRGQIGKTDAIGFKQEAIQPGVNQIDSIPIRYFKPIQKPDITTFKYDAPGTFVVGSNTNLESVNFELNGQPISQNQIKYLEKDSLIIVTGLVTESPSILVATASNWSDTVKTRIVPTRNKFQRITLLNESFVVGDPITLRTKDLIKDIDTAYIKLFNLKDSTYITEYTFKTNLNELEIFIPEFTGEKVKLIIKQGAIIGSDEWKFSDFEQTITKRLPKEFGTLNMTISQYENPIILEVITNNKVVKQFYVTDFNSPLKLEYLEPGEYTFKVTIDKNGNGEWDTGNFNERIQPEEIQQFSKPIKIRANWEIDLELSQSAN